MARKDRILALDIGSSGIKVGEFEYPPRGGVQLIGFAHREYDEELTEATRTAVITRLLTEILAEHDFTARKALISISGQAAFTRFVKLPPVADEEGRVKQIVEFEARQNVPFPMEEVLWDYQLISNPQAEELEVMFVVIKNEIVQQITDAVDAAGLDLVLVDVAPAASFNAARANHVGDEECAMILNIGCRSTNLLFADKNRIFARTIPIAGHSITQQIAREFGIGFAEAEELKRRHGFVALGGAYEEPESEVAAAVSKIIRNVMARLHGEINRSINVYRAQQKGSRPTSLYLSGGSSIMAYTDHFFSEKLRMDVHYLNPFQVMNLAPEIDRTELQERAHMFAEVIGLAMRYRMRCPVEVSLIPPAIRRQRIFQQKKPYIAGCLVCLLLMLFVALLTNQRKEGLYSGTHDVLVGTIQKLDRVERQIRKELSAANELEDDYLSVESLFAERTVWPRLLNELRQLRPDTLWLTKMRPVRTSIEAAATPSADFGGAGEGGAGMETAMEGGMGFEGEMFMMDTGMEGDTPKVTVPTGPIHGLELTGHAINLKKSAGGETPGPPAPTAPGQQTPGPEEDQTQPAEQPSPFGPGEEQAENVAAAREEDQEGAEEGSSVNTPEELFLRRIQEAERFESDPDFTRFETFAMSDDVRNLSTFVILGKFTEPIEFE